MDAIDLADDPDASYVLRTLRHSDPVAYLSVLFAPARHRQALAGLWAYRAELSRIADVVSDPMPGEIRLQWWRDVVTGVGEGTNPLGHALLVTIDRYGLSRDVLADASEAHVFDLYNDPMPDKAALEAYFGETRSVFFQMAAQILGDGTAPQSGDAAGHAGVALGFSDLLQRLALHRARRQLFVPVDVLAASGLDDSGFVESDDPLRFDPLVRLLVSLGREHLRLADGAVAGLDRKYRLAFLPLACSGRVIATAESLLGTVALEPFNLSPLTQLWAVGRQAFWGRFFL
jgi:phytoene synthase